MKVAFPSIGLALHNDWKQGSLGLLKLIHVLTNKKYENYSLDFQERIAPGQKVPMHKPQLNHNFLHFCLCTNNQDKTYK